MIDLNEDEPIEVPRASRLMKRDQVKWKGKGATSSSSDIEQMISKMDNLKTTLKQYLSVVKEKEKISLHGDFNKNTSHLTVRKRELALRAKNEIARKHNM